MNEKDIRQNSKDDFRWRKIRICIVLFLGGLLFSANIAVADIYHYKNFLVGTRAASMGGAFVGIADDAAGSFYNPAGIAFSFGDSISGSGNAFHTVNTTYESAIGSHDWERESSAILPNFFGLIKKFGESTFAISYVIPETLIEHQDQVFLNPNSAIERFHYSLHSEDNVYLLGPSFARKLSDGFSVGMTLYYYYREFREQFSQYLEGANHTDSLSYSSKTWVEQGLSPKLGIQWSPSDLLFVGVTYGQTTLNSSNIEVDSPTLAHNYDPVGGTIAAFPSSLFNSSTVREKRQFPSQLSIGIAYYPSPFLLVAADVDYFQQQESDLQNVTNLSVGTEYYLDATNALRVGVFTNNDSRKAVSSTEYVVEHIDMTGLSLGYASFSRTSSVSLGIVYSTGTGKAQPYGVANEIRNMNRTSMTMIFAASYSY